MRGTPQELAVANALDAATAQEQRARDAEIAAGSTPAELATAALLRLRRHQEAAAALIKDVVIAEADDPIPYTALAGASDREVVCIDLTDGGTVWCYDLDGEPRWLPEAEFQLWSDEDNSAAPVTTAVIVFFSSIIGVALLLMFWYAVLPSFGN